MKISLLITSALLLSASFAEDITWRNLDDNHRLGGRKVSEGYMRGKVVLISRWGISNEGSKTLMPRLEAVWSSYKTKPFVLLASHCVGDSMGEEVKTYVTEKKFTFPVYADAGFGEVNPEEPVKPGLCLIDETGTVRYRGTDERAAEERLVQALTDMEAPKDLAMWKKFIGFELKNLPGRAYLRLTDFRKKFPKEAKEYDAEYKKLKMDAEVQRLSRLVAFAKMAKDFDPKNKKTKNKVTKSRIDTTIKVYEPLKESKNPLISQEAKNALADLKWAKASL